MLPLKFRTSFILVSMALTAPVLGAANEACRLSLRESQQAEIGAHNHSDLYAELLSRVGFNRQSSERLSKGINSKDSVTSVSPEQSNFRNKLIQYMLDPSINRNMETYMVFQKWERFQRSEAYHRVVLSEKAISLTDLITMVNDVVNVLPSSLKTLIPSKYQTLLKAANFLPQGTITADTLMNLAKPLLGAKTETLVTNPLLSVAWSFVPQEMKTQAQEAVTQMAKEATTAFKETEALEGIDNPQFLKSTLRDLILDLDIAMTYATLAPNLKGKDALQLTLPENFSEATLDMQALKLNSNDHLRAVSGQIPIGASKFHVFIGSQSGRSYFFDTLESKSLMASLGMPELTVKTANGTPVVMHMGRNLDVEQANKWFKNVFETIKNDTQRFHLVVVDDLRVSAAVLSKLFNSLSRLGSNTSMLISWNKTETLAPELLDTLEGQAKFYQLSKAADGVMIRPESLRNDTASNSESDNPFDF